MAYGVLVINELRRPALDGRRTALVRIQYANLVHMCLGQDVVLYQSKARDYKPGYFAVATLLDADVAVHSPKYLSVALSKPRYFPDTVPLTSDGRLAERYLKNERNDGVNGRRAAQDFRHLPSVEFNLIVSGIDVTQGSPEFDFLGLSETEERIRQRVATESWLRSVKVREIALPPYDFKCAITRQELLSLDGDRSGLQICHAKSVASGGPDIGSNLFPLCPDFHTRYDQGTIDILDDYSWVPVGTRHDPIVRNWIGPRQLFVPKNPQLRLAPEFLAAHREEIFQKYGMDCRAQHRPQAHSVIPVP